MKKLICLLLTLLLACGTAALAEPVPEPSPAAPKTTEEKLTDMIPVLDSLARVLDGADGAVYNPANPGFVWAQLYQLAVNWYAQEADAPVEDGRISVPVDVLSAYAAASFSDLQALPALPTLPEPAEGAKAAIVPAEDGLSCAFAIGNLRPVYIVIERYAEAEEEIRAGIGLYESTYDFRIAGLTAILTAPQAAEAENSAPAGEARFPLRVRDIFFETDADFAELQPIGCYLRYAAPLDNLLKEVLLPFSALSWGSKGSSVAALQLRLNALGYSCGGENGTFGSGTLRAVRYFQDALGLPQDGMASAELQNRLFSPDAPAFQQYVNLREGSEGVRVEELQARLRDLGYLGKPVDGVFDARTREAVILFQRAAGLGADGIAGARTIAALDAADAPECADFIDLRAGDSGPRVAELQEQLIQLQYLRGWANGSYDAATAAALQAYLIVNDIDENGAEGVSAQTVADLYAKAQQPEPEASGEPTADAAGEDAAP